MINKIVKVKRRVGQIMVSAKRPLMGKLNKTLTNFEVDFIFLCFSKLGTLLSIGYIVMSSIPKNRQVFIFKRSQGP